MLCLVDRCSGSRHDRSIPIVVDVEALIWAENWKPRAMVAREKGLAWRSSSLEKITEFIVSHRPFGPAVSRRTAHFMLLPLSSLSSPSVLLWERLRAQIGGYDNADIDVYIAPGGGKIEGKPERGFEIETGTLFIMLRQKMFLLGKKYCVYKILNNV